MKAKSLILALCGAFISLTVSAQTTQNGTTPSNTKESWNKFYIKYNPISFDARDEEEDEKLLPVMSKSFSIGFTHTTGLSSSTPLFLELGLGVSYSSGSDDVTFEFYDYNYGYYSYKADLTNTLWSLYVPINLTYQFNITDKFALAPYIGARLRYNLSGNMELEIGGKSKDIDWFDEDDMGDDNTCNRFQAGYQVGINAIFNKVSIGLEYEGYFTELARKTDISAWSIGIGFHF